MARVIFGAEPALERPRQQSQIYTKNNKKCPQSIEDTHKTVFIARYGWIRPTLAIADVANATLTRNKENFNISGLLPLIK